MHMSPDELTGLLSRGEFLPRLQAALALASQHNQAIALVYVDLDHLLRINTEFGHVAGDDFIRLVGSALQQNCAGDCFAGRVGGDEFLCVAPGLTLEQVTALAERILLAVSERPLELLSEGKVVQQEVTASAGIAHLAPGESAITIDEFIRRAYEAALRAKETGGNALVVFSSAEDRDGLTGVLKRAGLLARLDQACSAAARDHTILTLLSFDIDEFEGINRQFGRYTGDEVLRRVAEVLSSNFKEPNIIGRIAGDEFIVLLPGQPAETAFILAEEVRKVIEDNPMPIQAGEMKSRLPLRISGGVAEFPADGSDWREILRKADEALYRAKQLGRNRICLPVSSQMVTKTSHFTQTQLEKLAELARRTNKSEAYLLREGLDDLLRKYDA
jgi:diguanylate cyclase